MKEINVDDILREHTTLSPEEMEDVKVAIEEIVEAVLDEAAENATTRLANPKDYEAGDMVDKSSILNTKEQVKY